MYRKGLAEFEMSDSQYLDTLFDLTRLSRFGLDSERTNLMIKTLTDTYEIKIPSVVYPPRHE